MPALELHLRPSKAFFAIMLFILLGALVSISCSLLPYYVRFLLGMGTLLYGSRLFLSVGLRAPDSLLLLRCREDGTWLLRERSGAEYSAVLCGDSVRWACVCILRFQSTKKRSAVVFYDAVAASDYRRLLMKLGTLKVH